MPRRRARGPEPVGERAAPHYPRSRPRPYRASLACPARGKSCFGSKRSEDIHSLPRPAEDAGPPPGALWLTELKRIWLTGRCARAASAERPKRLLSAAFPLRSRASRSMAKPTPLSTDISRQAHDLIASAVRTLEAEAGGVTALSAAIHDGLGQAFVAAVEMIRKAHGRLIVSGMGSPAMSAARSRRPSPPPARPPISCIPARRAMATSA